MERDRVSKLGVKGLEDIEGSERIEDAELGGVGRESVGGTGSWCKKDVTR